MTSKNLFLARMFENAKRRIWLFVVSILAFAVVIPTFTAMQFSIISQREVLVAEGKVKESLYEMAAGLYGGTDALLLTLISLFAIAGALQGFSYLYDRSKIDFYHSRPVETKNRFFTIWLNGILAWLFPYLAGTLINLVLFAANGILDVDLFGKVWLFSALAFCFYLAIYHLAILAQMLTGRLIVTCMGLLAFLLYEVGVRAVLILFCDRFYQFFCQNGASDGLTPILSPVTYMVYYANGKWSAVFTMFILLCFAAVLLAVSYLCYKKRPAEKAGCAMVFELTQPLIRIGIAVFVALAAGIITCNMVEYDPIRKTGNPGFPVFIGALTLVIVSCLIQVIYESDIKAVFHKKVQILITAVITIVIALIFRYDLTGYDDRLPAEDKMEYAVLITSTNDRYGNRYMDEDMKLTYKDEYARENMRLTGETAKAVKDLAAHSIELQKELREGSLTGDQQYRYAEFYFYQKNGSVICREIPIAIREEESVSYLKKIENAEEFIRANEPGMSEELKRVIDGNEWKVDASWGNSVYSQELTRKQARELLEMYRMDLLDHNYEVKSSELPAGEFSLYVDMKISYARQFDFAIYPSYTNCIRYLEENGFETKQYIDPDDVEKIVVTRWFDSEEKDVVYEETYTSVSDMYGYGVSYEEATVTDSSVSVSYHEQEQIRKILDNVYPSGLEWDAWYHESPVEGAYRVEVFFTEDSELYMDGVYSTDTDFLKDQVPDFIKNDTENAKQTLF